MDENGDGKADTWLSYLVTARLTRHGQAPNHYFTCEVVDKTEIRTKTADGSGRGAEFSSLCYFDGKLLTCDDRTGAASEKERKKKKKKEKRKDRRRRKRRKEEVERKKAEQKKI